MFQEIAMPVSLDSQLLSLLEIQFLNLSFANYEREREKIIR